MYIFSDIRSELEVNLVAIRRNAYAIKTHTGKELIAVVKADAYGHGAIAVADALKYTADMFAVATVEEAIELREAGIYNRIFILFSPHPYYAEAIVQNKFITAVDNWAVIKMLRDMKKIFDIAEENPTRMRVHVDINTGMNRSGIHYNAAASYISELNSKPEFEIHGVFTHLATADETDKSYSYLQLERFSSAIENIPYNTMKHAANSAAALAIPESHYDAVRPGLSLYGIYPGEEKPIPLEPAITWQTRVSWVENIKAGEGVSYGLTYKATSRIRVAGIQVGYGDGYPRSLSNHGEVLITGKRRPIIGRICMDLTVVKLEQNDEVKIGDEVVLIGKQGNEEITVNEIAEKTGTIPYEILTRIGKRVKRIYKRDTDE